jgi:hypothetical protein
MRPPGDSEARVELVGPGELSLPCILIGLLNPASFVEPNAGLQKGTVGLTTTKKIIAAETKSGRASSKAARREVVSNSISD